MMRRVARRRSFKGEIIMFTSDNQMGGWAYHWVNQMRKQGYEHWLILADEPGTCDVLQDGWAPMVSKYSEEKLSCVWSSYPKTHPGWNQWKPQRGKDSLHHVYILWATRWWVSWKLLGEGVSVLSLDVDAVLLTDIYPLLRGPPMSRHDVVISRNSDESQSLNCGFVYFNLKASRHAAKTHGEHCGSTPDLGSALVDGEGGGPNGVAAAEWVARAMWERIELFLDVDKSSLNRPPVREVLWEQDAWNDLAKTIETRKRIFPWAVGYGKESDLWPQLGYQRNVIGGMKHEEKWIKWKEMSGKKWPPWPLPDEPNAKKFYDRDLRKPLLWMPLCSPANTSTGVHAPIPGGVGALTTGIPFGMVAQDKPLLPGRLIIAPVWLSSLGTDPEADWADSSPPGFAYLHLTNLWHCFPHMCWSKAGRLFWLRAHRHWDPRLDKLAITPRGSPYDDATRTLSLPPTFYSAVKALTLPNGGDPPVKAHERWLSYRRMHALIHNLVTIAVLLDRKPVIPRVPCEWVRSIQQRAVSTPSDRSRFGISHPSVVVTGTKDQPVCHLAPGTWRPGGPDQCYHNRMMAQFDYDDYVSSSFVPRGTPLKQLQLAEFPTDAVIEPEPNRKLPEGASRSEKRLVGMLQEMCRNADAFKHDKLLQLDGLLPLRDALIDAPIGVDEFASEAKRLASGRPRWHSLLQGLTLKSLSRVCPGAQNLTSWRKACVGYFLAE